MFKNICIFLFMVLFFTISNLSAEDINGNKSQWTPFQISLIHPVQIFDENFNVYGIRSNIIYGKNADLVGVDFGLVNEAKKAGGIQIGGIGNINKSIYGIQVGACNLNYENTVGIQLGVISNCTNNFSGIQANVITNIDLGDNIKGLSIAGITNISRSFNGVQIAVITNVIGTYNNEIYRTILGEFNDFINEYKKEECLKGIQIAGLINKTQGAKGIQISGFINSADNISGGQIGLINSAQKVKGFQIGIINNADEMNGISIGAINIIKNSAVPLLPVINARFEF